MAQDWRTVKVFISSTFRDMQAERDHLVRFVFPKLREELLKRRIHLVDVDLRWGVTSDQDVLGVCQEIIDECRPRFVCILGGRYGFVPPGLEESITAAEIHYAVLHRLHLQEYRFFYFRDPVATEVIPETVAQEVGYREYPTPEDIAEYGQAEAEGRAQQRTEKLKVLKQDVLDAGFIPCCYQARWDESQQRLVDLQAFGNQVYDDLLWSIDDEIGTATPAELDEFAQENAALEAFLEERLERFVVGGRRDLLGNLTKFAQSNGQPNILLLTGASGSGKSALLGRFYRDYARTHPDDLVIPHFVGASQGSTDLRHSLRRLCYELSNGSLSAGDIPRDMQELLPKFRELLEKAAATHRVLLVIDALNQMDTTDNAHAMNWLPYQLPPNVRFIVSLLKHPALEALRRRVDKVREEYLEPLADEDGYELICRYLKRYRKNLEYDQIGLLLAKEESGIPLYLLTALEELRTLGTYDEITARLQELPGQVQPLFTWIFQRLEQDPGFRDDQGQPIGQELVQQCLSLLGVSRFGLSESELKELLAPGYPHAKPPIYPDPQGNVAALLRLLWPYLMHRGGLYDFYHGQFRSAAKKAYLQTDAERHSAHVKLAGYFRHQADPDQNQSWNGENPRTFLELPFHLARANADELAKILFDFDWLQAKTDKALVHELIQDYDEAIDALSIDHPQRRLLELMQGGLRLSASVIMLDKTHLAGQLTGRLLAFDHIDEIHSFLNHITLQVKTPWLRPLMSLTQPGGLLMRTLYRCGGPVKLLEITPDSRWIVSVADSKIIKVWDFETGDCLRTFKWYASDIESIALLPGIHQVICGLSNGRIKILDLNTGRCLRELEGHEEEVLTIAITPDARRIVSGSYDMTVKVWDLNTGACLLTLLGHESRVQALTALPDGKWLISGCDRLVKVWNLDNGVCQQTLEVNSGLHSLAIAQNGKLMLIGGHNHIVVWDLTKGKELHELEGHSDAVLSVAMGSNNRLAVSGGMYDATVRIWDIENGHQVGGLYGHSDSINVVAITPKGDHVISGSDDGTIKIWRIESQLFGLLEGHSEVYSLAFGSDPKKLYSGLKDGSIRIWNLRSMKCEGILKGHTGGVEAIAISQDGGCLVSGGSDALVRIWDGATGECRFIMQGHTAGVKYIALSTDDRYAFSANSSEIIVWDIRKGSLFKTLRERYKLPPSQSGTTIDNPLANALNGLAAFAMADKEGLVEGILVAKDGHSLIVPCNHFHVDEYEVASLLQVWDWINGELVDTINMSLEKKIEAIALTTKGDRVVTAYCHSAFARVQDLRSGEPLAELHGHTENVEQVCVIPDTNLAVTGGRDNAIKLWNLDESLCINTFEGHNSTIRTLAVNSCGSLLASADWFDTKIRLWDLDCSPQPTLQTHPNINKIASSLKGINFVTAGGGIIKIWNFTTGQCVKTIVGETERSCGLVVKNIYEFGSIEAVILSPDEYKVIMVSHTIVRIFDLMSDMFEEKGLDCRNVEYGKHRVTTIDISPDGRTLFTGSDDDTIKLWDIGSDTYLGSLCGHQAAISSLAVTRDGRYIISGSNDGSANVWDISNQTLIRTFISPATSLVQLTASGTKVITTSKEKGAPIQIWDIETGTLIETIYLPQRIVCWASNQVCDQLVIGLSDRSLIILDLLTQKHIASFVAENDLIGCSIGETNHICAADCAGQVYSFRLE